MAIQAKIEIITPERARQMLANNAGNRPLRETHVKFLTSEMDNGRWVQGNDAICVAPSGRLLNGQHRLNALIAHGQPVSMLVARNVSEDAFMFMDTNNSTRRVSDVLSESNDIVADAGLLDFALNNGVTKRSSTVELRDIIAWWRPAHQALFVAAGYKNGGARLSAAYLRVAFGLRWAVEGTPRVLEQYTRMLRGVHQEMDPVVSTIWTRIMQGTIGESPYHPLPTAKEIVMRELNLPGAVEADRILAALTAAGFTVERKS